MLSMQLFRADRVYRTGVTEPFAFSATAPVEAAASYGTAYTQITGATSDDNTPPPAMREASIHPDRDSAAVAVASAFAKGQSVRVTDAKGKQHVASPGMKAKGWLGKLVDRAHKINQQRQPTPGALPGGFVRSGGGEGAIPTTGGYQPAFERRAQAAQALLQTPGARTDVIQTEPAGNFAANFPSALEAGRIAAQAAEGLDPTVASRATAAAMVKFYRTRKGW